MLDCYGKCSPFRLEASGPTEDALKILAQSGLNTVRLRLWVNPSAHTPHGWPTDDYSYANLTSVLALARRLRDAHLDLWLDFHYSDGWSDPKQQTKPALWSKLSLSHLQHAVYNHTLSALEALTAQGTPPTIVQVGNEIDNGMLWAESDQQCSDGGALYRPGCIDESKASQGNWPAFASLVSAGVRAVRKAAPQAEIMIHTALANEKDIADIVAWYQNLVSAGARDWDMIGLSFYSFFGAGNTSVIPKFSALTTAFHGKRVVLAETAYHYQYGNTRQFPPTPAGQLAYIQTVLVELHALPGGGGVAWWGAEYYNFTSGAGWTGLWDQQAVALPALTLGWQHQHQPQHRHQPQHQHQPQ